MRIGMKFNIWLVRKFSKENIQAKGSAKLNALALVFGVRIVVWHILSYCIVAEDSSPYAAEA